MQVCEKGCRTAQGKFFGVKAKAKRHHNLSNLWKETLSQNPGWQIAGKAQLDVDGSSVREEHPQFPTDEGTTSRPWRMWTIRLWRCDAISAKDMGGAGLCAAPTAGRGGAVIVERHCESSVALAHVGGDAARDDSPGKDTGNHRSDAGTNASFCVATDVMDAAWVRPDVDGVVAGSSKHAAAVASGKVPGELSRETRGYPALGGGNNLRRWVRISLPVPRSPSPGDVIQRRLLRRTWPPR